MNRYEVVLAGKWGGSRSIFVSARSETHARSRARELAFGHERIVAVYQVTA